MLAALIALCAWLPRPWVLALGRQVGRLFYRINQKRVAIAHINLQWCFPDLTTEQRDLAAVASGEVRPSPR